MGSVMSSVASPTFASAPLLCWRANVGDKSYTRIMELLVFLMALTFAQNLAGQGGKCQNRNTRQGHRAGDDQQAEPGIPDPGSEQGLYDCAERTGSYASGSEDQKGYQRSFRPSRRRTWARTALEGVSCPIPARRAGFFTRARYGLIHLSYRRLAHRLHRLDLGGCRESARPGRSAVFPLRPLGRP
jgi:hypothetical protein